MAFELRRLSSDRNNGSRNGKSVTRNVQSTDGSESENMLFSILECSTGNGYVK